MFVLLLGGSILVSGGVLLLLDFVFDLLGFYLGVMLCFTVVGFALRLVKVLSRCHVVFY